MKNPATALFIAFGVFALIILSIIYYHQSISGIWITQKRFESMVRSQDVDKIVIVPSQYIVEVTLKREAVDNDKYREELENQGPFSPYRGPHYQFRIVKPEVFNEDYMKLRQEVEVKNEEAPLLVVDPRSNAIPLIINWGFLFLLFSGFIAWLVALVEILRNQFHNPTDKIVWLLAVILVPFFGFLFYFFFGRQQRV